MLSGIYYIIDYYSRIFNVYRKKNIPFIFLKFYEMCCRDIQIWKALVYISIMNVQTHGYR